MCKMLFTKKVGSFTLDTLQIYFPWDDDFYTYLKNNGFGSQGYKALCLVYSDNTESTVSKKALKRKFIIRPELFNEIYNSLGWTKTKYAAEPIIPFKRNIGRDSRSLGSSIWKKMYLFYTEHQEAFMHHYHKRSNSESTFHMIKRKLGSHLRSKSETGQTVELLAKCLVHNLYVLIQEAYEIGIELDFKKCADIPIAHKSESFKCKAAFLILANS